MTSQLVIERLARQPERFRRLGDPAFRLRQRRRNRFFLECVNPLRQRSRRCAAGIAAKIQPEPQREPFRRVSELPDIAGPVVCEQPFGQIGASRRA